MRVEVRVLGGFDVVVDAVTVPREAWRRRQAAGLVKLLAITPGHRLHREQVIDALWPELMIDEAAPRLHKAAHFARSITGSPDAVVIANETVALFPSAEFVVDVDVFDELAASVRPADEESAAIAVEAYGGDLLPDDLYEPWAEQARESRKLRYLELLRQAGRWAQLVAADPTDEEAHLKVVQGLIARGDRAAALRQLDFMEATLRRELDVAPSEAAEALREEAMAMTIAVDPELHVGIGGDTSGAGTAPARAVAVPRPATPTIGRERELARIDELIERSPIVTLLGPGGVGKTRLATEVALRRSAESGWEAFFVDLTRVRDASLVPGLIVRDLGVHIVSDSDALAVLEEVSRGRRRLLVLDNYEHVIDAAPIVGEIARRCPELRVLVTSRARLRIAGETVVDVEPLEIEGGGGEVSDAVRLFAQSASAIDPSFDLAAHLEDVTAICRSIDGLPLAIELAAGHIRTLPPVLLRSRLGARLGSSSAAARDAPERQQTIPATIDWSLQLLTAAQRRMFVRLGVFESGVPLEAIEQVCADEGIDAVDVLAHLVDQSLVRRTIGASGEPRFVLLELLRERARELLGDERAEMRRRHAIYIGTFLDDLDERRWGDAADHWIDTTSEMLAEIRAAHAWAVENGDAELAARITAALGTFWHREGHYAEARRWVAESLAHLDELDERLAARIRVAAGFLEWPVDSAAARAHWVAATDVFRRLGDDRYLAYVLALSSATFIGDREHHEAAIRLCDEGIALSRAVGELPLIAQALNIKGELARVHGDDDLALAAYEEGRDLAAAAGDRAHLTVFLANLSYLADHRGDYDEARRLGCEALRLCRVLGRRMMAAWTVSELAGPEIGLGRPERGAIFVGAADEALRALGARRHPGDVSEHDRVVAGLRSALGDERFAALQARGAKIPLDDVIELALSETDVTLDVDPVAR